MQVTDEITWYMRSLGLSRADLATRMEVSAGRVSQVLSGGENLTLRTLVGLATAVGARFELRLLSDNYVDPVNGERAPTVSPTGQTAGPIGEIARIQATRSGSRPDL